MEDAAAADIINEFSSDGEGIDDFIEEDDSPECQLQKEITKKVDDYNLRMVKLWEETSLKKQSLEAEIALFNSKLKLLKEANLANEKDLRMKRRKAEERCLRAIKKYDDDISEQHEIMCELIEELNLVTKEEDELKEALERQLIVYDEVKGQRELEKRQAFESSLEKFMRNRAARVIQNAWKRYLLERAKWSKKKSKKSRKKK